MTFRTGALLAIALATANLWVAPAAAAEGDKVGAKGGDKAHGQTIAKRWCASCHVVTQDQKTAQSDAPSFYDIAQRRTDRKQLSHFLADPHPRMPDMHLSRREIDDIVSYIRSLDPRPQPPEPDGKDEERPKNG